MNIIETNLSFRALELRKATNRIFLHHAEAYTCTPEQIHQWHLNNGWSGAGYHLLVRKDGSIYRLRPEDTVGAHASGANFDSIGICFEGKYNEETMPQAQINAGKELVSYLKNKYGINTVLKHSDVCKTSCPGDNFPFDEIANGECTETICEEVSSPVSGVIADIQTELNNRYGYGIAVDNIYGNETKTALVKALQNQLNIQMGSALNLDGIFGSKTKSACPNLLKGIQGEITWLVQAILICKGYDPNGLDGIYGEATAQAVKQFQADEGLVADAICGKNTFEKLFK